MRSEFMFSQGHCSIILTNGYRISMTNYETAHCRYDVNKSDKYRSFSNTVELMVFDPIGQDITKVLYPDASPDKDNLDADDIAGVINRVITYRGPFRPEDLL